MPAVHEPVDLRVRITLAQRRRHGQRVHDVAERAEADDQDLGAQGQARLRALGGVHCQLTADS